MSRYILRRALLQILVLIGLSILTFFLVFKMPGDPLAALLAVQGWSPTEDMIAAFESRWGLDQPLHIQYLTYMNSLIHGDLGNSMVTGRPILEELLNFFPATVELGLVAAIVAILVGVPAGVVSAVRRNSIVDQVVRVVSLLGVSMPIFWLAIIALYVFYFRLGWLPSSQRIDLVMSAPPRVTGLYLIDTVLVGDLKGFASTLHHLLLPAAMLAFSVVGLLSRITRASMLEVLSQDYIRTARSKGLRERYVLVHHALRNALVPSATAMGLLIGAVLSGAVLTETVFAWPGLGRFAVQSIFFQDRAAIMGVTLLVGVIYSVTNLVVDIAVKGLDPRIEY